MLSAEANKRRIKYKVIGRRAKVEQSGKGEEEKG
jgi:hypothetical protein